MNEAQEKAVNNFDTDIAVEVTRRMSEYVDTVKQREPKELVGMALINIDMEQFRQMMMKSGAPAPLLQQFMVVMDNTLTFIAKRIDLESLGGHERFLLVRDDLIRKGNEITADVVNALKH